MHLYFHIPFCRAKCPYCDFYSTAELSKVQPYLKSLKEEFELSYIKKVQSVYFGGGTPSLIEPAFYESILKKLSFKEATLELNPEDADRIKDFSLAGFNRISVGVQSADDKALKSLGRRHDAKAALRAVELALKHFKNVSVDLICGIPGQSTKEFEESLKKVLKLNVKHVSVYMLTHYAGTAFEKVPQNPEACEQYLLACEILKDAGFVHYEVSNFAKAGFECLHNLAYWLLKDYVGFGASSVGLKNVNCGAEIYRSPADVDFYIKNCRMKATEKVCGNDYLLLKAFLRLRTNLGLELPEAVESSEIRELENGGFVFLRNSKLILTDRGFLVLNSIFNRISKYLEVKEYGDEKIRRDHENSGGD